MRTLEAIKSEISTRLQGKELIPSFIERTSDFISFCNAIGEFFAPFVQQLEEKLDIYTTESSLADYLKNKGMILVGNESLAELQTIAQNRLKILVYRGTYNMLPELQRLCQEEVGTTIQLLTEVQCGWWSGVTSPNYVEPTIGLNTMYSGISGGMILFKLNNQNVFLSDDQLIEIIRKYLEPKHIPCLYLITKNFIRPKVGNIQTTGKTVSYQIS